MINLKGYQIKEKIYESGNSSIFRGVRNSDKYPVVIKLLNKEYPSEKELSGFVREYEIMNKITGNGIITGFSLEKYNNSLAVVMEDIGGESIAKVLSTVKLSFAGKLSLAINMTESLVQTHQQNIIHKDVNPSNFIWNNKTDQVKIIDFGISTELTREAPQCVNLNIIEGTLNYISPEQTGRINRPLDYRTDLYSLGITFYELFTGKLPFYGDDEIEIVYCHIAKTPVPPCEINPEITVILSDIIMKLISKTTEERYQSAFGLLNDLKYCQHCFESSKDIRGFIPGQKDIVDRFEIPHKLYGREAEIEMLIAGFEKAAYGNSEFLPVSGYSGVGKSSLIHEVRKSITGKKGYFISGKFNQFERNNPYYGITLAFQELIKQLLSESQQVLDNWKRLLMNALGGNGQLMVDIIPELDQIIGHQPQLNEINPLDAQNRFQMIFIEFIKVFAMKEHPLVIFLDDLQWGDASTLDLLKSIMAPGKVQYVLIIAAYRDNEVQEGHPMLQLLEEMKIFYQDSIQAFRHIILKPLELSVTNQLISDTFHCLPDETEPLTKLVFQKTKGNPFFIKQLLYSLYLQGIFSFQMEKGQWKYELEKVESVEISDNVIDLLVQDLKLLPVDTVGILNMASCIGNQFDLTTVSLVSKKPIAAIGKDLWIALEEEIILPLNNNYRFINTLNSNKISTDMEIRFCFSHDRIRQAVYSLIPEIQRAEIHLKIGREYLKTFLETKKTDVLFEMVNHLNIGSLLIREKSERIELSDLNVLAGNKAKKSTAYAIALSYFEKAEALLSGEEWASTPDKLFSLLLEQATAAMLSGELLKADGICEHLSKIADNNLKKGAVSNIKVLVLEFQGKLIEAIDDVRKTLVLFNVSLPLSDGEIGQKIQEGIMKMQQFLARVPCEEIVNLPVMSDPEKIMTMQLLFQVIPPAIQTKPSLYILASLMMFDLTTTYGISPLSCKCIGDCGAVQGTMLTDYKTGYKLGEAAFALINKFNAESFKSPVYFIFTFISYWRTHFKESLDYYDMSFRAGLANGDLLHTTYSISHKVHLLIWAGKNLTECKVETENAIAYLKQVKGYVPLLLAEVVYNAIRKFQTIEEQDVQMDFERKDNELMASIDNIHNLIFMGRFYQYNTFVNIISGNMESAEKWNMMAEKIIFVGLSDFPIPDHYLFQGLILIHKWSKVSPEERAQMRETLIGIQQRLKNWAENSPSNFSHKYFLLSAELAIVENQPLETIIDLFKNAIDSINNNDFIQLKALCNELYGKFWMDRGDETIAKAFIREAYYLYKQWGAYRKTSLMDKQYPQYLTTHNEVRRGTQGSSSTSHNSIDMISILKSSQAISSEIKIDKLVTILIGTMIENAGAQHGCLLLNNEADNQLYIEAIQNIDSDIVQIIHSQPYTESKFLCPEIIQYVARTKENVVIQNACSDVNWQDNPYIMKNRIKSVLCMPVIYQNRLKGIVYLENNLSDNVFTSERLEILKIFSSQASISIENAGLYENMEEKVRERTTQLEKNQKKLVISEKMASLGRLTAGIAHEMNSPLAAIRASLKELSELTGEYRKNVANSEFDVNDHFEISDDMAKSLTIASNSLEKAIGFIRGIKAQTMDMDQKEAVVFNAIDVINDTMLFMGYLLRKNNLSIEFNHASNPMNIFGFPERLAYIVTNLISNAADAMINNPGEKITINLSENDKNLILSIKDKGCGIPESNLIKIYDPFFSTKPFGKSTGLGLTIIHDIVYGEFNGRIEVESEVNSGTEFRLIFQKPVQE